MDKKLLVLGGTAQQKKFVEAAHKLGIQTVVVDYLPNSPAKQISDLSYDIDATDVERVTLLAERLGVDGVVCGYIDPLQKPYHDICKRLGLPCYGTEAQFTYMTDKRAFKRMCRRYGVGVVPDYSREDIESGCVDFPAFVKPVDSRGSRGQRLCWNLEELEEARKSAAAESSDGGVLVERFFASAHEFQITYFYVNGTPYLVRTTDSYTGSPEHGLEKVVLGAVSPSRFTRRYLESAEPRVLEMFAALGVQNGPIFMQGFEEDGEFYFFDPGRRFPGVDYERMYARVFGVDLAAAMVEFALTGSMPQIDVPEDGVWLGGGAAAVLFPTIRPGVVGDTNCFSEISSLPHVISCIPRVAKGDEVALSCDVNQRAAEIDVLVRNRELLAGAIDDVQSRLSILDSLGRDMRFEFFDSSCL